MNLEVVSVRQKMPHHSVIFFGVELSMDEMYALAQRCTPQLWKELGEDYIAEMPHTVPGTSYDLITLGENDCIRFFLRLGHDRLSSLRTEHGLHDAFVSPDVLEVVKLRFFLHDHGLKKEPVFHHVIE